MQNFSLVLIGFPPNGIVICLGMLSIYLNAMMGGGSIVAIEMKQAWLLALIKYPGGSLVAAYCILGEASVVVLSEGPCSESSNKFVNVRVRNGRRAMDWP